MKYFYFFSIAILIMIGCSTSRVTKSWKNENIVSKSYKKVLVLGLFGQLDRDYRVKMEEHMVGDLSNLGYKAISSVKQYGSKAFENMGEKEALTNLAEFGFDAVVTIVLLNKEKEINFIPAVKGHSGVMCIVSLLTIGKIRLFRICKAIFLSSSVVNSSNSPQQITLCQLDRFFVSSISKQTLGFFRIISIFIPLKECA